MRGILKHKFIKSVGVVVSGTVVAQIINLVATPFITRLYGPEEYGIFGTFTAIFSFVASFSTLNYQNAIVLPRCNEETLVIRNLSFVIALLFSVLISLIIMVIPEQQFIDWGGEGLAGLLFFFPIGIVFYAYFSIGCQFAVRENRFNIYSSGTALSALLKSSVMIIVGGYFPKASSLVFSVVITYLITACYYDVKINFLIKSPRNKRALTYSLESIAKKYKDFAIYRTPQVALNYFSHGLPIFFLASAYGIKEVGYFTLSRLVLTAPANLIGQSVATVFYPKFNQIVRDYGSGSIQLLKSNVALFLLSALPLLALAYSSPWLFSLIFGQNWSIAGSIASWLCLSTLSSIAARPSVAAIPVLMLQRFYLVFEIASTILRALALYLGVINEISLLEIVMLFAIVNFIIDCILIIFVYSYSTRGND